MSDFRRLLGYVRPHLGRFSAAVVASALAAAFTVALPVLVRPLIDVELKGDGPAAALGWPRFVPDLPLYAFILLAFFGKGLFSYFAQYLMSWVGERAVMDLRAHIGRSIVHKPLGFFAEQPTGALISRLTSDAEKVLVALSEKLHDLVKEPLTMAGLAAFLFWKDWPLAIMALVLAPLVAYPVVRFGRRLRRASESSQERLGELASRLHEVIRGARVVKAAGTEELESGRLARAARGIFVANLRAVKVMALTPPIMEVLAGVGIALAFFYGRTRIASGAMTQGDFLSFLTALFMLYTPAKKLSRVQASFEQALASARRCFTVIDCPVEVLDAPGAIDPGEVLGEIAFERVSFRYHETWVLRDLDFHVAAGSVAALVGRSGSGKSTIASLILRFYDASEGRVTIDGHDVRRLRLSGLRRHIGLVAQDVVLFNDTLRANLAYGVDNASESRIVEAARAAFAHDFIERMPRGYETVVGERGAKLSAGQRQRVAIARALLKDPPILILDEATSALDAESEALVVEALGNLMRGRTTLVIAHRLTTVRRADQILVVEDGRIREAGTHDELMRQEGGLYNRLAELQAVGEIA